MRCHQRVKVWPIWPVYPYTSSGRRLSICPTPSRVAQALSQLPPHVQATPLPAAILRNLWEQSRFLVLLRDLQGQLPREETTMRLSAVLASLPLALYALPPPFRPSRSSQARPPSAPRKLMPPASVATSSPPTCRRRAIRTMTRRSRISRTWPLWSPRLPE